MFAMSKAFQAGPGIITRENVKLQNAMEGVAQTVPQSSRIASDRSSYEGSTPYHTSFLRIGIINTASCPATIMLVETPCIQLPPVRSIHIRMLVTVPIATRLATTYEPLSTSLTAQQPAPAPASALVISLHSCCPKHTPKPRPPILTAHLP